MDWCHFWRKYVGMLIAIGLVNLQAMSDFFSMEPTLSHPWFPSILSRDRFQQINRYFHVSETLYPNDKLAKLQAVVDNAITKFRALWTPPREISIHEQMIRTLLPCRIYPVHACKNSKIQSEKLGVGRLSLPLCLQLPDLHWSWWVDNRTWPR